MKNMKDQLDEIIENQIEDIIDTYNYLLENKDRFQSEDSFFTKEKIEFNHKHYQEIKKAFKNRVEEYQQTPNIDDEYLANTFNLSNDQIYSSGNGSKLTNIKLHYSRTPGRANTGSNLTSLNENKVISLLSTFRFVIPKQYREELLGDIYEVYFELKKEGHNPFTIYTVLTLQILNVGWAAICFKYNEFFKNDKKKEKN